MFDSTDSGDGNNEYFFSQLQWKPLNVITLGPTESDNINRMITVTGGFYLVSISKWDNQK